jgi:hypothetical protein
LALAALVIAISAEPNTYDSLTYHLPRIEHWVAQRTVAGYPTMIDRQVTMAPGHEYLLTHLRLLTGGDAAYNMLQWMAAVGCVLAATRIAAQLGGDRRAQLLTALTVATTPVVVMQASGTQNDLVVTAWVACVATFVLDGMRSRVQPLGVVVLALGTGLVAVTKNNGLLAAGPLLGLWGVAQLRLGHTGDRWKTLRGYGVTAAASVVVLVVAGVLVGPFTLRMFEDFGTPLGPPSLRDNIPMQRHDVPSVAVNGLRILLTSLDTPVPAVRSAERALVYAVAAVLDVDAQDPKTTYKEHTFPTAAWQPVEDVVSFPVQGTLAVLAVVLSLLWPRQVLPGGGTGVVRGYAGAVVAAAILFAATIKWQPWVSRLVVFLLVLVAPLVGLWLAALVRSTRRPATVLAAGAVAALVLTGVAAVAVGYPRGALGRGSVFSGDALHKTLVRRAVLEPDYRWVLDRLRASGATRVGLVQWPNDFEYPWWKLLPDANIVSLTSVLDQFPARSSATPDAIICTADRALCERVVPHNWRLEYRTYAGYALPPPGA